MENVQKQLADKLNSANHVLVTVSRNPSVDQLSSCIALALLLNKLGKHATAVFSGEVPSTLEFLKPEDTLEKTTDSLRDFIIALDKSKADKLRYKVEDNVVRIFITPYRTSITADDLDFSQGDFNVDVVVALGVERQEDLDEAITAHGRILHDAAVTTITTANESSLGSINWNEKSASSLCELVTQLGQSLGTDLLDEQIATALLTGIVAETARFSNEKTSSQTMSLSAALMAAGANQQLVASKLDVAAVPVSAPQAETPAAQDEPQNRDGSLDINHNEGTELKFDGAAFETSDQPADLPLNEEPQAGENLSGGGKLITQAPAMGGTLTANSTPEGLDPTSDPFSFAPPQTTAPAPLLDHGPMSDTSLPPLPPAPEPAPTPAPEPAPSSAPDPVITGMTPPPPAWIPPTPPAAEPAPEPESEPTPEPAGQTLSEIEAAVHAEEQATGGLNAARDEVLKALNSDTSNGALPPIDALGAQPMVDNLNQPVTSSEPITDDPELAAMLGQSIPTMPTPTSMPPAPTDAASAPQVTDPNAPPPVPPPIPFNFGGPTPPAT